MHLKSIELREVGPFSGSVRIDGIEPGLNVLAGANELGKSTVLRALTALFQERYSAKKQSIQALRPYSGGAPFVRCAFELDGGDWSIEKQFLSAQGARLVRIGGAEAHQGADAENRLADLLGAPGGLLPHLPLLWAAQGESFDVPKLSDGNRLSLGQLLAAQADNTSGIGAAQAVLRSVEAEIGTLVTQRGPKKGGAYDLLLKEQSTVAAKRDEVRLRAEQAEVRLDQLATLQREAAELSDTDQADDLKTRLAAQNARLDEAREARRQLKQLAERTAFLVHQKQEREASLTEFDDGLVELENIKTLMGEADVELTSIADALVVNEQSRGVAAEKIAATTEREQALRAQLANQRAYSEQVTRRERLEQLIVQRQRLDQLNVELADIGEELSKLDWPETTFGELRDAAARRDQLRARYEAGAPRLKIRYLPGVHNSIRIGGEDLVDGTTVSADGPTTIEIEGIGQIEVSPGASEAREVLEQDLRSVEDEVAQRLSLMSAGTFAEAEQREAHRSSLIQRGEVLRRELDVLAPDGRAKIENEYALLMSANSEERSHVGTETGAASGTGVSAERSAEELTIALEDIRAEHVASVARLNDLKDEKAQLDQRRTAIATELRMRRTRRDDLAAGYLRADGAPDPRDALASIVGQAGAALNAALREKTAWVDVALDDDGISGLETEIAQLQLRGEQRSRRLGAVREEMQRIEGMLARDFEDGCADQVREHEARLVEIAKRIADVECHISALRLLASELEGEMGRRRDEISEPLRERLSGFAQRVWPGAGIELTSELTVGDLSRGDRGEAAEVVSAGTREQMSVLARLAYCSVLSDGDGPLPVILDDPLAFSDDQRLDALFEVMRSAASAYQIIVLTCHERAFEPLVDQFGATRLAVREAVPA